MSDALDLREPVPMGGQASAAPLESPAVPRYETLQERLEEASRLIDDIVLKNYLTGLSGLEIVPLEDGLKGVGKIRLFKISEMVYQRNEYSTYKFASVFNAVQGINCGVFIVADSNEEKTEFYMGVRSLDNKRTVASLKRTLENALRGQFPGVKTENRSDPETEEFLERIPKKNIAAVSCVANNKDDELNDDERFIQGLEKLALALRGQRYTAVILARGMSREELAGVRQAYEQVYTGLSPFANMQASYSKNQALNISEALSRGTSRVKSHGENQSFQRGRASSTSDSTSHSESKGNPLKAIGPMLLSIGGFALGGGLGAVAGGLVGNMIYDRTTTDGTTSGSSESESSSRTRGTSDTYSDGSNESRTKTSGRTAGTSENLQLTIRNKSLADTLERIEKQLKRIDECESLGMWECAAYFLSDSQETAEMAAGTYKAIMRGEHSGIEASTVNFWGRGSGRKLEALREYILNFIHPVFTYRTENSAIPVTAAASVSGNELAIHMGLPRKSVCGFPVVEHAEFAQEIVSSGTDNFPIGKIFSMGEETKTEAKLSRDSLTMHAFVTGSTGAGKSNTVWEVLNQLRKNYKTPFLVIEPAKGEYKNVLGGLPDVTVYGTNPKKFNNLLRLNPFRFPADVHVLEHLDRLVEVFNVCWPMYAAMPAVLKEAMEKAYEAAGWDLALSENPKGSVYPTFADVLDKIEEVIEISRYSADTKGDYIGSLCTRVRSLANGLNGLIFCKEDLPDEELFDRNVIVDLSRIGSVETKALIMGLLVTKLNEYRSSGPALLGGDKLSHVTVLEEAHNLLKRTSTEQTAESSNLLGKSVELLANSIAEMRAYGEGFIIADQSPGLMDMSVIRNTNTKIILRLPDQSDRELAGYAAGLDEEQVRELAKLERGVAAVYQNDWVEPALIKINKCGIHGKAYEPSGGASTADPKAIKKHIVHLLLGDRLKNRLEFDVDAIEKGLSSLDIPTGCADFIEEAIDEYRKTKKLAVWRDDNFRKLSHWLVRLLDIRARTRRCVLAARDNDELTEKLGAAVREAAPGVDESAVLELCHCALRDMSASAEAGETLEAEKIYRAWYDSRREGGKAL